MEIVLNEAVRLKSVVSRKLRELLTERERISFVTVSSKKVEEGASYEKHDRTVEEVTLDIEEVRKEEREISYALSKANLENTVKWDGEDIPLTTGLLLSKQLRAELEGLKSFSIRNKVETSFSYSSSESNYDLAQYEPKEYKKKADKLERQVNKLSSDLNAANYSIYVDIECADKYYE